MRKILLLVSLLMLLSCRSFDVPATTPGNLRDYARQQAMSVGIDPEIFVRQIEIESGFNPQAVSPAGAIGIAQFMPETAALIGVDPWNAEAALDAAARLMRTYNIKYGGWEGGLAAYNCGEGCVTSAMRFSNWKSHLPLETKNYIIMILG